MCTQSMMQSFADACASHQAHIESTARREINIAQYNLEALAILHRQASFAVSAPLQPHQRADDAAEGEDDVSGEPSWRSIDAVSGSVRSCSSGQRPAVTSR